MLLIVLYQLSCDLRYKAGTYLQVKVDNARADPVPYVAEVYHFWLYKLSLLLI